MDEVLQERELEQYHLERLPPEEQQDIWDQEYLNELQGNPAPRPYGMPMDDLERYATDHAEQLRRDEFEQTKNIDEMHTWDRLEQYHRNQQQHYRNEQQLIQKQFLCQQLQQPTDY